MLYLLTTAVAIVIGLALGNLIQPGVGMNIEGVTAAAKEAKPLADVILDIFCPPPFVCDGNVITSSANDPTSRRMYNGIAMHSAVGVPSGFHPDRSASRSERHEAVPHRKHP